MVGARGRLGRPAGSQRARQPGATPRTPRRGAQEPRPRLRDHLRRRRLSDGSWDVLKSTRRRRSSVRLVRLRKNSVRRRHCRPGSLIHAIRSSSRSTPTSRTIPGDIPRLLEALGDSHDVVSGLAAAAKRSLALAASALERRELPDPRRQRRAPPRLRLHAQGVPARGHRGRELLRRHAPLPSACSPRGSARRVTEMEVNHHPRTRGVSKYGLTRIYKRPRRPHHA